MWVDRIPRLSSGSATSTAAPAPSPNSTQVLRSDQSMIRDSTSTPMISTRLNIPRPMKPSAVAVAYRNPAQAADRSKAAPPGRAPSFFCT
jgi:hypothetical protein